MEDAVHQQPITDDRYKRVKIEIPASALEVKARFWTEPTREKQLEIKRFSQETGTPYLHPDVTHSKPPEDAEIVFLEMFDLPEKFGSDQDQWSPCPICSPDRPQFKNDGIITWSPQEGVIRVIGGDCFETLNPKGAEQAKSRYRKEVKRRLDEGYLLRTLWRIPLLRSDVKRDLVVAHAVDAVHSKVQGALGEYKIALWTNAKGGVLQLEKKSTVIQASGARRELTRHQDYAQFRGKELIDPDMRPFGERLAAVEMAFANIDFGSDYQSHVIGMTDLERRQTAILLKQALKELDKVRDQIEEAQRFLGPETAATVRTWSQHPHTTCPFFFDFEKGLLRVGLSLSRSVGIDVPSDFFEALTPLPGAAEQPPN